MVIFAILAALVVLDIPSSITAAITNRNIGRNKSSGRIPKNVKNQLTAFHKKYHQLWAKQNCSKVQFSCSISNANYAVARISGDMAFVYTMFFYIYYIYLIVLLITLLTILSVLQCSYDHVVNLYI